jgi:LysR family transcriptional regulator, glycine cleavage system transcriptional activator
VSGRLPSLRCIEAFALAATSLSFTRAAGALHITVPAVSRRIRALESELGVALFRRTHGTLKLTRAGENYAKQLSPALEAIRYASDNTRSTPHNSLRVGVTPCFAATWLLPRLHKFYTEHPRIELELDTSVQRIDPERGDIHLSIQLGPGTTRGLCVAEFMDVSIFPVCAPTFLRPEQLVGLPGELLRYPLLACRDQDLWPQWLRLAAIAETHRPLVRRFDSHHLVYEAAASGLGIALAVDACVQPALAASRLMRVSNVPFSLPDKFYVTYRARARESVAVRLFHRWLVAEGQKWPPRGPDGAERPRNMHCGRSKVDGLTHNTDEPAHMA